MSPNLAANQKQKRGRGPRFWLVWSAVFALLIILLIFVPLLVLTFSIIAIIVGLIALARGRMRWARIPNRARAGALTGSAVVLLFVSAVVFGSTLPEPSPAPAPVAGEEAGPTEAPDLESFVGESCEADHLVMTQGSGSNYCDKDSDGALVWVGQESHEEAKAQAKDVAEKKAAKQAKASEEAAAKQAVEAKQKAAAKKAAAAKAEKIAAERKAKASEEAAAKQAVEAKQKAAAKKAAAREAERVAAAKEAARQQAQQEAEAQKRKAAEQQTTKKAPPKQTGGSSTYYKNCTAVRAAGADPIYAGQPGYSRKLDRDGDGVACE